MQVHKYASWPVNDHVRNINMYMLDKANLSRKFY